MEEPFMSRREKWAQALESGLYPQSRFALCWVKPQNRDYQEKKEILPPGYCCLGVAVPVYIADPSSKPVFLAEDNNKQTFYLGGPSGELFTNDLPAEIEEYYGISTEEQLALSEGNDKKGWTFAQVAQYLKKGEIPPGE